MDHERENFRPDSKAYRLRQNHFDFTELFFKSLLAAAKRGILLIGPGDCEEWALKFTRSKWIPSVDVATPQLAGETPCRGKPSSIRKQATESETPSRTTSQPLLLRTWLVQ